MFQQGDNFSTMEIPAQECFGTKMFWYRDISAQGLYCTRIQFDVLSRCGAWYGNIPTPKRPCAVNPFAAMSKVTKYPFFFPTAYIAEISYVADISLCQNVKRKKCQCAEICPGQKTHVPRSPWCGAKIPLPKCLLPKWQVSK